MDINDVLLYETVIADFDVPSIPDPSVDQEWVTLVEAIDNEFGVIIDHFTFNPPGSEQVFTQLRLAEISTVSTANGSLPTSRVLAPAGIKIEYDNRRRLTSGTSVYMSSFQWALNVEGVSGDPVEPSEQTRGSLEFEKPDGDVVVVWKDSVEYIEQASATRAKIFLDNGKNVTVLLDPANIVIVAGKIGLVESAIAVPVP